MMGIRRSLALIGAITLVALSCGEPSPLGVDSTAPPAQGDLVEGDGVNHWVHGLCSAPHFPKTRPRRPLAPKAGPSQWGRTG